MDTTPMRALRAGLLLATAFTPGLSRAQSWTTYDTTNAPFFNQFLNFVYLDDLDRVWTGIGGQGMVGGPSLYCYADGIWTAFGSADHPVLAHGVIGATCDSSGTLWFSVAVQGVLRYDGTTWEHFDTGNSPLLSDWVLDLVTDHEGDVWFACYPYGVVEFNGTDWHAHDHTNSPFSSNFNGLNDLYIDVNNYLYVADNAGPLRVYHQDIDTWVEWTPQNSGIPDLYPISISGDPEGHLFIGFFLYNAGPYVSRWDGANWTTWFPFEPPYDACGRGTIAYDGQGGMLMGGAYSGLWRFNGDLWYQEPGSPTGMVSSPLCSAVSSTGRIWYCSSYNGLWTQGTGTGLEPTALPASPGLTILSDPGNDQLHVSAEASIQWVELRDSAGRVMIREHRSNAGFSLDVSRLGRGAYILTAGSARSRTYAEKVLIP